MTIKEAKCLELLMDNIYYHTDINNQIKTEFGNSSEFLSSITILKTELIINSIINNRMTCPNQEGLDIPLSVYNELIDAFLAKDYIIYNDGSVYIKIGDSSMHISEEWLAKLNNNLKNSLYQKIYLYNKKKENDITDETGLQNYIYHTKTFLVESNDHLSTTDLDDIFSKSKQKTEHQLEKKKNVKVDQVIASFIKNSHKEANFSITKFKVPSTLFVTQKANKMGINFYKLPLHKQKSLICEWFLEYINYNSKNNEVTEAYLHTLLTNNNDNNFTKQNLIPGLFSLYISILNGLNIDYSEISLFEFHIKIYLSNSLQIHLKELQELIKQINRIQDRDLSNQINKLKNELKQINPKDSNYLIAKNNELNELLTELKSEESITSKMEQRNSLQNIIHYEQETCLNDIAFDNDKIMELITESTKNGRVYINPLDKNKILIELYNKELGKITFQAEISIEKIIEFINTNNCIIEDSAPIFNKER